MTDFTVWRSCDLTGLGVGQAINRNSDIVNRGVALLNATTGLPDDDAAGSIVPELDITATEWGDEQDGAGTLPPGTYDYKIIPVDTCTGRTGTAIPMPPQTVTALGKTRKLRMTFGTKPTKCDGIIVQRDGVVVSPPLPISRQVLPSVPVVRAPDLNGTFTNAPLSLSQFTRVSGADLIVGDAVSYQGSVTKVVDVTGSLITFDPPIPRTLTVPPGFYDIFNRTGIYEAFSTMASPLPAPPLFPIGTPPTFLGAQWPGPFLSFKIVGYPVATPFLADLQSGDIINYGSKTAIVVYVETNPLALAGPGPTYGTVLLLPFGLLPLPPLPVGVFQIVYRSGIGVNFGPFYSGTTTTFRTLSIQNGADPVQRAIDFQNSTGLNDGAQIVYDSAFVGIGGVVEVGGGPFPAPYEYEVTITPELQPFDFFGVTVNRPIVPIGVYATVPRALSPYLSSPTVAPNGSYTRLSRITSVTTESNLLQWEEDGTYQNRLGTITTGVQARQTLDNLFTQAGYRGGLNTLLEKVRGPSATLTNRDFNNTLGQIVRLGDRLITVNNLSRTGNTPIITLAEIRALREQLCGSFSNVLTAQSHLVSTSTEAKRVPDDVDGFVVYRFESREVMVPAAACPPGEPDSRRVELFCIGPASKANKLRSGEQAKVLFAPNGQFQTGIRKKLISYGLTDEEATAALALTTTGRVVYAASLSATVLADIGDFGSRSGTSDANVDELLNETRITIVCLGGPTRDQINTAIQSRGRNGIVARPPGTDPATTTQEGYKPIPDFTPLAANIFQLVLEVQYKLDLCDFAGAIASIPDENTRNAIGAVLAIIEAAFNQLASAGIAFGDFLKDIGFVAAMDMLAGLISGIASDPTLACLIGPNGQLQGNLPSLPLLDTFLQGFAFPFTARFNLTQLFAMSLQAIVCALVQGLIQLLNLGAATLNEKFGGTGSADNAFLQQVIGCLPNQDQLALSGIQLPTLDVQVTIECSLTQLNTILDMITALIAEASEIIDFINGLAVSGIPQANALNQMCSGAGSITDVMNAAVRTLGLDSLLGG